MSSSGKRSKQRRQQKRRAAKKSKNESEREKLRRPGNESGMKYTAEEEVVAAAAGTSTGELFEDLDRHPDDAAVIGSVIARSDESQIRMSQQGLGEPVNGQSLRQDPLPDLRLLPALHLIELVAAIEILQDPDGDDQLAVPYLPIGMIAEGRADAPQTTVTIEIDPIPAVITHAHVLPEETDGDADLYLPASCRHRPLTEIDAHGVPSPSQCRGPDHQPVRAPAHGKGRIWGPGEEDLLLKTQKRIEEKVSLVLARNVLIATVVG